MDIGMLMLITDKIIFVSGEFIGNISPEEYGRDIINKYLTKEIHNQYDFMDFINQFNEKYFHYEKPEFHILEWSDDINLSKIKEFENGFSNYTYVYNIGKERIFHLGNGMVKLPHNEGMVMCFSNMISSDLYSYITLLGEKINADIGNNILSKIGYSEDYSFNLEFPIHNWTLYKIHDTMQIFSLKLDQLIHLITKYDIHEIICIYKEPSILGKQIAHYLGCNEELESYINFDQLAKDYIKKNNDKYIILNDETVIFFSKKDYL